MKIFVTGGAGYIGGTVAAILMEKGHRAVIFDNLSHSRRSLVPSGAEFIEGELADRVVIERIFKAAEGAGEPFDGVLHFAALIEAGESMQRPEIYFPKQHAPPRFRCLKRCLLAAQDGWFFPRPRPFTGSRKSFRFKKMLGLRRPTLMANRSSSSSRCWLGSIASTACVMPRCATSMWPARTRVPTGITRGESHEPESHLIPLVLDVALGRRPSIRIYGDDYPTPDGTCIRDYIHVSDLAEAHLLALAALSEATEKPKPIDL